MTNPTFKNIHNQFKLNGFHYSFINLKLVAYTYIKEGEPFEKMAGNFILDWLDDSQTIDLQTSGTTGLPKIITVKKQAMVYSALATGDFFELKPGDKALNCLSTQYIAGKMMFVRAFILGLDLDFVAPSSKPLLNNKKQYDFIAMVTLQAEKSINDLLFVKKIIVGGGKINSKLEQKLMQLPIQVYETFAMTETITHIAAKRVGETVFTVLPNITISCNEKNCLVINAVKISDEKIVTNDLVEITNTNQFKFLGRIDNVVNSGGIKLIPEQIEHKLINKINSRFFVIGIPDDLLGEKLILIIEGENHPLNETIFDDLDQFEKPKMVFFVSHFKENPNGKILRKETITGINFSEHQ
jgi:o-succinylbenzoate---CoA ligase